jgi:outer membrane protein assembly factor BamD
MKKLAICLMPYALCLALAACGGGVKSPAPDQPLAEIYANGYAQMEKKRYKNASEEFLKAESQFPASEWAADALIMAAYSQYLDGDFAGALMTTDRFMRFHPGHKDVAYVLYLRGSCYYRQVSDVRREPGMSVYALQAFQQLNDRFPRSPYYENAANKIMILKNYIAGKMMYSARRDMKKQNWTAAIDKLQQVVAGAQETVMTPEAMFRLTECYTAVGLPEQAAGYAEMLKKNFPDNEWMKKL